MNEVENKAIKIVLEYERKQGRNPRDVSKDKTEVGYDVLSGERKIEVKGLGRRNPFFKLNSYNFESFRKQPNFYLYLVFDIKTSPKLIIWDRLEIAEMIKKAKVYFDFEIPLRKENWESGKPV